uniref:Ig-like domain-containing protein n=1 Tax=Cyprinus carpio TaxID=7962 RepID=A0A8C1Z3C7_CYPCA
CGNRVKVAKFRIKSIDLATLQHSLLPDVVTTSTIRQTAKIQCSHSVPSYNQINWYRQNQDHGFTLMGYLVGTEPYKENDFKDKIEMSGDGKNDGYLNIKSLSSNDNAVYFCAAYYTAFKIPALHYKNFSLNMRLTDEGSILKEKSSTLEFKPNALSFVTYYCAASEAQC